MPELLNDVLQTLKSHAAGALTEVAETMAFLCAIPVAEDDAAQVSPPTDAVRLDMSFSGPMSGRVEVVAPEALGAMILESMLCADAVDTQQARHDALLELMNMTCGALFHNASSELGATFNIGLPQLQPFDATENWAAFTAQAGVSILDIDGLAVAIRVSRGDRNI